MANATSGVVSKHLATLFQIGAVGRMTDGELLEQFLAGQKSATTAFTALVERHGPMVLDVCRAVLGNTHSAEDASQATFLILARRATAIRRRESVASWLFGVARRVATRARRDEARRRTLEMRGAEMAAKNLDGREDEEAKSAAFEELDRLPESLRTPIVLCILEGYTQTQAAELLRWPLRTLERRLAKARKRLRERLVHRGLAPSATALALSPASTMPPLWIEETVQAAISTTSKALVGMLPTTATKLANEVQKAMFISKLKVATALGLSLIAIGGSSVALRSTQGVEPPSSSTPPSQSTSPTKTHSPPRPLSDRPTPAGRIVEGRILDIDGKPAKIDYGWILAHGLRSTSPSLAIPGSPIKLDAQGNFRVVLPAEEWTTGALDVTILATDHSPIVRELPAGTTPSRIEATLEPVSWQTTEVVVTDVEGKPVVGATYEVLVESKPFANLTTDKEGRCRPRMAVNLLSGFRLTAKGFRPVEQYRKYAPESPEIEGIRLRRSLRGVVLDFEGKPAAMAWIGGEVTALPDSWRAISPPDAIRVKSAKGQDLRNKQFELRDEHGNWQPISSSDVRPAEIPQLDRNGRKMSSEEFARKFAPYEVRIDSGWWMSALPMTSQSARSDAEGRFAVDPESYDNQRIVFASRDFSQIAVHTIHNEDPDEPLQVKLKPARPVSVRLLETSTEGRNPWLTWIAFEAGPGGTWGERCSEGHLFEDRSDAGPRTLKVLLPSGRYRIDFRGESVHHVADVNVPEGSGPFNAADVELPLVASARMVGKPAAEIDATDLEGKTVKLADFRGKVVILDFWGAWCGPCIVSMPKLAALQEKFRGQPVVILALHDASVATIDEYRKATAKAREQLWGGRDLPFTVLIDRPNRGKSENAARPSGPGEPGTGSTNETYEMNAWPSTFLIDRSGKMVGHIELDALESAIRRQLGQAEPKAVVNSSQATPRATTPIGSTAPSVEPVGRRSKIFHGRVLGPNGRPIAGAKVTPVFSEAFVVTATDGTFNLNPTDPFAPFSFRIESKGLANRSFQSLIATEAVQDFTLTKGCTVTGRVVQSGKPVPGVIIGLSHADTIAERFLGQWESTTDKDGVFRFSSIPEDIENNLFGTMRSLKDRGAVPSRKISTGAEGATLDVGDLVVIPAHSIKGRVVFSDGLETPKGSLLQLGVENAWDSQRVPVDSEGKFEVKGVPPGGVSVAVVFPNRMYSPDGYRLSSLNKGQDPMNRYLIKGRVDGDVADLILLYERGEDLPPNRNPTALDRYKEIESGPLTGAAPSDIK